MKLQRDNDFDKSSSSSKNVTGSGSNVKANSFCIIPTFDSAIKKKIIDKANECMLYSEPKFKKDRIYKFLSEIKDFSKEEKGSAICKLIYEMEKNEDVSAISIFTALDRTDIAGRGSFISPAKFYDLTEIELAVYEMGVDSLKSLIVKWSGEGKREEAENVAHFLRRKFDMALEQSESWEPNINKKYSFYKHALAERIADISHLFAYDDEWIEQKKENKTRENLGFVFQAISSKTALEVMELFYILSQSQNIIETERKNLSKMFDEVLFSRHSLFMDEGFPGEDGLVKFGLEKWREQLPEMIKNGDYHKVQLILNKETGNNLKQFNKALLDFIQNPEVDEEKKFELCKKLAGSLALGRSKLALVVFEKLIEHKEIRFAVDLIKVNKGFVSSVKRIDIFKKIILDENSSKEQIKEALSALIHHSGKLDFNVHRKRIISALREILLSENSNINHIVFYEGLCDVILYGEHGTANHLRPLARDIWELIDELKKELEGEGFTVDEKDCLTNRQKLNMMLHHINTYIQDTLQEWGEEEMHAMQRC